MIVLTDIVVDKLEEGIETLDKSSWFVREIWFPFAEFIANDLWALPKILFTAAIIIAIIGTVVAIFKSR